jgi:hypothetical protein
MRQIPSRIAVFTGGVTSFHTGEGEPVDTQIRLIVVAIVIGSVLYLLKALMRSIRQARREGESTWEGFGLSLSLLVLFLIVWFGHGLAEWQEYKSQQEQHNQPVELSGYVDTFTKATLENWQSEFLQVFAFVVLAGLYIHRGSAESKDGEDEMMQALKRIEAKLGTNQPDDAKEALT